MIIKSDLKQYLSLNIALHITSSCSFRLRFVSLIRIISLPSRLTDRVRATSRFPLFCLSHRLKRCAILCYPELFEFYICSLLELFWWKLVKKEGLSVYI